MKTGLKNPATLLGIVAAMKMEEIRKGPLKAGALNDARDLLADTGLLMQAKEAVKHEEPAAGEFQPLLIEGRLESSIVEVPMPNGEVWRFAKPHTWAAPCPVLVCLHTEKTAMVFRPSAEGVHPFLGIARRFGVDAAKKGGSDV
jgi:hypothetical protein